MRIIPGPPSWGIRRLYPENVSPLQQHIQQHIRACPRPSGPHAKSGPSPAPSAESLAPSSRFAGSVFLRVGACRREGVAMDRGRIGLLLSVFIFASLRAAAPQTPVQTPDQAPVQAPAAARPQSSAAS